MDTVSIDIQQKISALQASWDDTVSSPYVLKMNPSMIPTLVAAISRDGADVQELSDFVTDELTGKLEGISGVAGVTVSGAATRQMHIVLDQEKLNAVSARLADAVSAQMDAAEGQLTSAQAQITSAQQAIDNALSAALTGAADEAAAAVNQAIGSITQARDDAQTAIRNQRAPARDRRKPCPARAAAPEGAGGHHHGQRARGARLPRCAGAGAQSRARCAQGRRRRQRRQGVQSAQAAGADRS